MICQRWAKLRLRGTWSSGWKKNWHKRTTQLLIFLNTNNLFMNKSVNSANSMKWLIISILKTKNLKKTFTVPNKIKNLIIAIPTMPIQEKSPWINLTMNWKKYVQNFQTILNYLKRKFNSCNRPIQHSMKSTPKKWQKFKRNNTNWRKNRMKWAAKKLNCIMKEKDWKSCNKKQISKATP